MEEGFRLGCYIKDAVHPPKIRFKMQTVAEEVIARTQRLARKDEYKDM